jgi:hypothetical protein
METLSASEAIQVMLAPAVAISAVGLLLLALNNRYSTLINRMRLLNDEKRRYLRHIADQGDLAYADNVRFMSVTHQTDELLARSRLVRNAILSHQTAISMFVLTSVAIGVNLAESSAFLRALPLVLFLSGMIAVFVAIVFAGREVWRSYRNVLLEARAEE